MDEVKLRTFDSSRALLVVGSKIPKMAGARVVFWLRAPRYILQRQFVRINGHLDKRFFMHPTQTHINQMRPKPYAVAKLLLKRRLR